MSQLVTQMNLSPGKTVIVTIPYWGGTIEFINNSPYDLSGSGGNGSFNLNANNEVCIDNMPNGTSFNLLASQPSVLLATGSLNFSVIYYNPGEKSPYPPTQINPSVQTYQQGGAQSNIWAFNVAAGAGGTDTTTALNGQSIYLHGFDVTGDKSASLNTGIIRIDGLVNPLSGNTLNQLKFYVTQGPTTGTTPMSIRFPVTLQTAPNGTLTFTWPNMASDIEVVEYYEVY